MCKYCLQQWVLAVSLLRENYSFGNSLGGLRIPMGFLCPVTNKIKQNLRNRSFAWWQDISYWCSLSPIISWFHLDPLYICIHFMKFLVYQVSILPLKWPLELAVPLCIPSLVFLFSSPPTWYFWSSAPSIHNYLFYFPLLIRLIPPSALIYA